MTIYLGTQGWSYKDWVGSFYPPGARAVDYLSYYARIFDAVELDTTFYGTPTVSKVESWAAATPQAFQFTAKVPRAITHDRRLIDAEAEMEEFVAVMQRLGEKLGAVLIQLPPDFTADERPALEQFLRDLPDGIRFAAEFRHRSWLTDDTYDLLRRHNVAWTMIDLRYMPITLQTTAGFAYVRWLGDHRKVIKMDATQIDNRDNLHRWAEELEMVARRVERIYGFVNNHYSGHSPADVRTLRRALGMVEEIEREPRHEQGSLL